MTDHLDKFQLVTNSGGNRVFNGIDEVRNFARTTAAHLASISAVFKSSNEDDCIMQDTFDLLNDLAFQLQQAVDMVCTDNTSPAMADKNG